MRFKPSIILLACFFALALSWSLPAVAGCETECSGGSSESDIDGCRCCCIKGKAVCEGPRGNQCEEETLALTASPQELASYRTFIHRLQDSGSPELRAMAVEAQAIYDAVLFHDPARHGEAIERFRAWRQTLSATALQALAEAREALRPQVDVRRE